MKKIYSALIVLLLFSLTITSCTGNSATQNRNTEEVSKEIALTADNIREYLNIEGKYGAIKTRRVGNLDLYSGESNVNISIFAISPGAFKNVVLTIGFYVSTGWDVSVLDSAYDENNENYLKTTIILPANGSCEEIHKLFCGIYTYSCEHGNDPEISILSVSGTFIPAY